MPENTRTQEQPHSVSFAVNAKGQLSGEVKTYGVTPDDAWQSSITLLAKLQAKIAENNKVI